jgi:hypothetical protein
MLKRDQEPILAGNDEEKQKSPPRRQRSSTRHRFHTVCLIFA